MKNTTRISTPTSSKDFEFSDTWYFRYLVDVDLSETPDPEVLTSTIFLVWRHCDDTTTTVGLSSVDGQLRRWYLRTVTVEVVKPYDYTPNKRVT